MGLKTKKMLFFSSSMLLVMALSFTGCTPSTTSTQSSGGSSTQSGDTQQEETIKFPTKPIRVIIPVSAGGFSDLNARLLTDVITEEKLFSQPMIVVNITGANGAEGIKAAMESEADGHTIMFWQTLSFQSQYQMGGIPYSVFDLDPLAQVIEVPNLLVASADAPYDTVEELLEYAKANPGEVKFCHSGVGNSTHLAQEAFYMAADLEPEVFKTIGVAGGAESLTAHLGKQVDVRFSTALDSIRYVESGDFKLLASTGTKRPEEYPDTPTMVELGYDLVFTNKQGYWIPKGVDERIQQQLADAIEAATKTQRYSDYCASAFADPVFSGLDDFRALLEEDDKMIADIVAVIKGAN